VAAGGGVCPVGISLEDGEPPQLSALVLRGRGGDPALSVSLQRSSGLPESGHRLQGSTPPITGHQGWSHLSVHTCSLTPGERGSWLG
jgi:hypothetical protein